jgi:uncharacterized protein (DUF58 family)
MTGRFLLLCLLVYTLLFAGFITRNGGLVALAIPLVIYLVAALYFSPDQPQLKARRTLSEDRVQKGMVVNVLVQVENEGPRLEEILLEDVVPEGVEVVEGKTRILTRLLPGGTAEFSYTVRGKRGYHYFKTLFVQASDQLGLFRRRVTLPAPAHLLVMPEFARLRPIAIRPLRTHDYTGSIPSRQGGSGVSFFDVRQYQVGDSLRRVNWRVTARHRDDLFTNNFEQERIADVGLILDARQQSDVLTSKGSLFEYGVLATASLADTFIRSSNRVGLVIYGRGREITFPGYGKFQRERIFQSLARAQTGDNLALEHLDYLPTRFFPARSQIVLISPLIPDDLPVLVRLVALGYSLLVLSPDPVHFELMGMPKEENVELAARIAGIERALLLHKMQRAGIQVVNWQVDQSLNQRLHSALRNLPRLPVHWRMG